MCNEYEINMKNQKAIIEFLSDLITPADLSNIINDTKIMELLGNKLIERVRSQNNGSHTKKDDSFHNNLKKLKGWN